MAGMLEISSPSMRADRETAVRAAPFFAVAMDALTGLVSADAAAPRKMQLQVAVGARLGANAIPLQSDAVDQRDTETESTVSVGAGPDVQSALASGRAFARGRALASGRTWSRVSGASGRPPAASCVTQIASSISEPIVGVPASLRWKSSA